MINILMNMKDREFLLRGISRDHRVSPEKVEEVLDQVLFWVQGRLPQAFEQIEAAKADHMVTVKLANEAWNDGREYGRREMRVESKLQQFGLDREVETRNITEALKRYKDVADVFSRERDTAKRRESDALRELADLRVQLGEARNELRTMQARLDVDDDTEELEEESTPTIYLESSCEEEAVRFKVSADREVRIVTAQMEGLTFLREEEIPTDMGSKITRRVYESGKLPGDVVLLARPNSWWRRLIVALAERVCE